MTTTTNVKAGSRSIQHNESLPLPANVKAGGIQFNHNQSSHVRTSWTAAARSIQHNQSLPLRSAVKSGGINMNLRVRADLKAGGLTLNHNQTFPVRTNVKAGGLSVNHTQSLRIRTHLKAGGFTINHNQAFLIRTLENTVELPASWRTHGAHECVRHGACPLGCVGAWVRVPQHPPVTIVGWLARMGRLLGPAPPFLTTRASYCTLANQNTSFAPSWMLRLPLALVMLPNDDVLNVADGLLKFVWLNRANVSNRNWNFSRSLIGKFLNNEKLTVSAPGPWSRLRPAFP